MKRYAFVLDQITSDQLSYLAAMESRSRSNMLRNLIRGNYIEITAINAQEYVTNERKPISG